MKSPQNFKIVKETLLDETEQYRVMEFVTKRKFPKVWETEQVWVYVSDYDGYTESEITSFPTIDHARLFIKRECKKYYQQVINHEEI